MIKNLGTKEGRLMVFGGPYSNIHALKALRQEADRLQIYPENIICTGDIVGYCAYARESILFVRDWGINAIAGNVEFNLREESDDCGCNFDEGSRCDLLSKQWFPYAKSQMDEETMEYLFDLPEFISFTYNDLDCFVLHGSFKNTSEFIFKSTSWEVKMENFRATDSELILAGHCGIPFIDTREGHTWLNAGVIGMPANDGTMDTWYVTIDGKDMQFHRLSYDFKSASAAMQEKPLPKSYALTLRNGIWDNCDILPHEETIDQGRNLKLHQETKKLGI